MTLTTNWLIKLKPADKFFFGGEQGFQKDGIEKVDYLLRSNYFPQQTAVLGMVRHLLLITCPDKAVFDQNKIQDAQKASELIGKRSFRVNDPFEFGKIKGLSPMFIRCEKANKNYLPLSKEYLSDNFKEPLQLQQKNGFFHLEGYDPKKGIIDLFTDSTGTDRITYSDFFDEVKQVGIRKNYDGNTEDNAYYFQYFKKFRQARHNDIAQDLHFAFYLTLDASINLDFLEENPIYIPFGGEQQLFAINAKKSTQQFSDIQPSLHATKTYDKLVLMSDAKAPAGIDGCVFAISETVPFRFLETSVQKDGNYCVLQKKIEKEVNNLENHNKLVTRSQRYELYKRGSVFYGDSEKMKAAFTDSAFQAIGYNHFKIENKNGN